MKALTHVTVCKIEDEKFCKKIVFVSVCHYCDNPELLVTDVDVTGWEPKDYPAAVSCGGCGMVGPWGKTEEEAVDKWNEMSGVEKEDATDWEYTPLSELEKRELPF